MTGKPWSLQTNGVALTIRLTPKSARDAIEGVEALADGRAALIARVRALPSEGKANAALIQLIARTVGVPPRDIVLASGATGRLKRLLISGDGPTLAAALEKIASPR